MATDNNRTKTPNDAVKITELPEGSQLLLVDKSGTVLERMEAERFMELVRATVQVGGRNLLKGTSDEWAQMYVSKNAGFSQNISLSSLGLRAGDQVTFSMKIKPSAAGKKLRARLDFYESEAHRLTWNGKKVVTDESETQILSGIIPDGYPALRWGIDANDTSSTVSEQTIEYYKAVKLERGNIPTDWTPAPEDVADLLANRGGGKIHIPNLLHFSPAICGERSAA